MAAIVVGAIGLHIINDVLESDEEDDNLEDIFAISGASLMYARLKYKCCNFIQNSKDKYEQKILKLDISSYISLYAFLL